MSKIWNYGNSWEKYPIENNEIWSAGPHRVMCGDGTDISNWEKLFNGEMPDMVYSDPPWNTGNINSFRTKAGLPYADDFNVFIQKIIDNIKAKNIQISYLEAGVQNCQSIINKIRLAGGKYISEYDITYYGKKPAKMIVFSFIDTGEQYNQFLQSNTGTKMILDDEETPIFAIHYQKVLQPDNKQIVVFDMCTGRGLTGRETHNQGGKFLGIELNKRRLANLLEWYAEKGLEVKRVC